MTTATALTPDGIRAELLEAFRETDKHGGGLCSCCDSEFPDPLRSGILAEINYAFDRYEPGEGSGSTLDEAELNALRLLAERDAVAAVRAAIIERAARGLTRGWDR